MTDFLLNSRVFSTISAIFNWFSLLSTFHKLENNFESFCFFIFLSHASSFTVSLDFKTLRIFSSNFSNLIDVWVFSNKSDSQYHTCWSSLNENKYCKLSFFSCDKFLNFSSNFSSNLIVAFTSFIALWAQENQTQKLLQSISKLRDFSYGHKKFARKNVSIRLLCSIWILFFIKKSLSKKTLCQSRGVFPIKSNTSCFTSSIVGACSTSQSWIFVRFEIRSGIGIWGLINVEYVSIVSKVFSSNFTKAISIILSLFLSRPVVSKSNPIIIFYNFSWINLYCYIISIITD